MIFFSEVFGGCSRLPCVCHERLRGQPFLFTKRKVLTHGQRLLEELPDKEAHSERLQTVFFAETERPAKNLPVSVHRGQGSQVGRELKHQEDEEE